jgi:hypothetical protein
MRQQLGDVPWESDKNSDGSSVRCHLTDGQYHSMLRADSGISGRAYSDNVDAVPENGEGRTEKSSSARTRTRRLGHR